MISATFAGVMQTIGYVCIAILALMFMVIVHEFGHYLAGKILKFKILEFSIGFGPAIFKHKNKKTGEIFSVRPFPLGGFCQFEGEDEDSKSETAFNNQAPWKRLIVLFSGAFFNFISALIVITLVFTFYGQLLPTVADVYDEVADTTCALKEGDVILAVNGSQVNILMNNDFTDRMAKEGNECEFKVLRDGKALKIKAIKSDVYVRDADGNITLDEFGEPITRQAFGFVSAISYVKLNFFRAFGRSFSFGFYVVFKILYLLGMLLIGKLKFSEAAGGPVTIISTMSEATKAGFGPLAYVICIMSANLAVMNLLPFPALDGSRMVFTAIEWVRKKPMNRKFEAVFHFVGLIVLFGIAIVADILQILK